jgi:hypothetical protein
VNQRLVPPGTRFTKKNDRAGFYSLSKIAHNWEFGLLMLSRAEPGRGQMRAGHLPTTNRPAARPMAGVSPKE